ncbi:MAG: LysM peptidoglycan-binding domain-containing protein [Anaerolineae bacterium]|nr:LysM peptidoglycan-binding domain-containing protein [Anaerolineae bacterium]
MGRRQTGALFLLINVVVSIGVAFGVITFFSPDDSGEEARARPTIIIVVTATPDPNQPLSADALQQTVDAQALTITAAARELTQAPNTASGGGAGLIPTTNATPNVPASSSDDLPTLPPQLIPSLPGAPSGSVAQNATGASTPQPEDGCERYFVQSGDTASTIANRFGVTLPALLVLNDITDQTILQIGQELLVPGPTCQPDATPTPTITPRPTFNLTFIAPTAELPPTVENPEVAIVAVENAGDITREQVVLQNLSGEIALSGWTLEDGQGNLFTFPAVRLVPGSLIRVQTRTGTNTPGFLYWNQSSPMWEVGETVMLYDDQGELQATFTVGGEIIDFGTPGSN